VTFPKKHIKLKQKHCRVLIFLQNNSLQCILIKRVKMNTADKYNSQHGWNIPGVELVTGEIIRDTWESVIYEPVKNTGETGRYISMLMRELLLYPQGYPAKAGVRIIVPGRDLEFNGEYRAAVPDPYRGVLYLSINGSYGESGESYLMHVLHHELHHMLEYAVWKDMYFNWAEWNKLNPEGFSYGRSESAGYSYTEPDYYTGTHPLNGFLNLYSMTGGEEDRCELMAFLMSVKDRKRLLKYYRVDSILKRKVDFISRFVNDFAGSVFVDIERYF
jgi:hypothetical protein